MLHRCLVPPPFVLRRGFSLGNDVALVPPPTPAEVEPQPIPLQTAIPTEPIPPHTEAKLAWQEDFRVTQHDVFGTPWSKFLAGLALSIAISVIARKVALLLMPEPVHRR